MHICQGVMLVAKSLKKSAKCHSPVQKKPPTAGPPPMCILPSLLLSLVQPATKFTNPLKVSVWMDFMHLLPAGLVSFCLQFAFWHRLALSASLLDEHGRLQSEVSSTISTSISLCYWKHSWWCVNWCPHEPEGAGILSAKNNSNNDMEKCEKNMVH